MKTIAIGDIHGEITKLKKLIEVLGEKDLLKDRLIFLGDYIDRGEDSVATLDYLITLKEKYPHWVFLRGNHEEMLLEAYEFGVHNEISSQYLLEFRDSTGKIRLSPNHLLFLKSLKLSYRHLGINKLFTHGGINKAGKVDTWAIGLESPLPSGVGLVRGHVIHPYVTFYQDDIAVDTGAYDPQGFLSALIIREDGLYDAPAVISIGQMPEHIKSLTDSPVVHTKRIRTQQWPNTNISEYLDLEEMRERYSPYAKKGRPLTDFELICFLNLKSSYTIYILEEKILI